MRPEKEASKGREEPVDEVVYAIVGGELADG